MKALGVFCLKYFTIVFPLFFEDPSLATQKLKVISKRALGQQEEGIEGGFEQYLRLEWLFLLLEHHQNDKSQSIVQIEGEIFPPYLDLLVVQRKVKLVSWIFLLTKKL